MPPVVLSVTELPLRSCREDAQLRRTFKRTFRVQFNTMDWGESYALYAPGIPLVYMYYSREDEADLGAEVIGRQCETDPKDPHFALVTIEYGSHGSLDPQAVSQGQGGGGGGGTPPNENPLDVPIQVTIGNYDNQLVLNESEDTPKKKMLNSAKQPFQPRPTRFADLLTITVVRNEATFDWAEWYLDWNKVNEEEFYGFGPRTVLFRHALGQSAWENRIRFVKVTYLFIVKLPDWDFHPLDEGNQVLNDAGDPVPAFRNGLPLQSVLLDGSGKALPDGSNPVTLNFKRYKSFDFSQFNLDPP